MNFRFASLVLCLWALVSCNNNTRFSDLTHQVPIDVLSTPEGVYAGVAWLKGDELVFDYAPQPNPTVNDGADFPSLWDFQLWVHDLAEESWLALSVMKPDRCRIGWVSRTRRLPNGSLGFIYQCEPTASTRQQNLTQWNPLTKEFQTFKEFPEQFTVQSYSFAPAMSQVVLAEQGGAINDKIYIADSTGPLQQVFAEFARAASPSWSVDGNAIAFVANEKLPTARDNPFTALVGIVDLLFYPWDLYMANAEGANPQIILSEIKLADVVKWSPVDARLAFRGEYKGVQGIWILNTKTSQLTRVWKNLDYYDWSPDGTRMVVLEQNKVNGKQQSRPVIIDAADIK